ncbi:CDK-activating kinase assembly factor MAT1-like [Saccoglossus kowalevskii]|uniref:CDK-activating kinase assembly factor MAT1-like n=1 Tax=Saccoglossus kowalevskii TaxID=10224 RepID=A0ABM0GQP7_SACKO|nr:PREDICTED: CDK-activating kinase assembly factor MAT1-like [Saccoglossus kowalevskii]
MDDQYCPHCKTTKYRNPSLKLLVNICGHSLCENCVDLLFARGSGSCPECNTALRRNNFRLQLFEDPVVEKEVDIRKRILKDYCKKEEDFSTLREFNDYLEDIETIIFNLANNIDVESTKKKMEEYRKANREQIMKSKGKLSKDEAYIEALVEQERCEEEEKRQMYMLQKTEEKKKKTRNREALIDDLMFSDQNVEDILATYEAKSKDVHRPLGYGSIPITVPKPATKFSSGIRVGVRGDENFLPIPKLEETLFIYKAVTQKTFGPAAPSSQEVETLGYTKHVRPASPQGIGGGYQSMLACHRAMQDAFCGLFYVPEKSPSPTPSVSSTISTGSDSTEMDVS